MSLMYCTISINSSPWPDFQKIGPPIIDWGGKIQGQTLFFDASAEELISIRVLFFSTASSAKI